MAVTINFEPPTIYNVSGWQLGQAVTSNSTISVVASGTDVGSYPTWINQLTWSGAAEFYYSVRFISDDGFVTAWSDRNHGVYGTGFEYFIIHNSGSNTIYIVPPPVSGEAVNPNWLTYNTEYTVTVKASGALSASGLYGSNTDYMAADHSFTFTAEYCAIFSTVESVRLRVGPIIDGIPDDTINRMIYQATWDLITRFYNRRNPYGCTYDSVPEVIYRWVTCMAGIYALNAAIAGGGTGLGNTTKKLGTFSVTYDGGSDENAPGDIREDLNKCVEQAGQVIGSLLGSRVKSAVQSLRNTQLKHPMADALWGRMPRKLTEDGTRGPWDGASQDYTLMETPASGQPVIR